MLCDECRKRIEGIIKNEIIVGSAMKMSVYDVQINEFIEHILSEIKKGERE